MGAGTIPEDTTSSFLLPLASSSSLQAIRERRPSSKDVSHTPPPPPPGIYESFSPAPGVGGLFQDLKNEKKQRSFLPPPEAALTVGTIANNPVVTASNIGGALPPPPPPGFQSTVSQPSEDNILAYREQQKQLLHQQQQQQPFSASSFLNPPLLPPVRNTGGNLLSCTEWASSGGGDIISRNSLLQHPETRNPFDGAGNGGINSLGGLFSHQHRQGEAPAAAASSAFGFRRNDELLGMSTGMPNPPSSVSVSSLLGAIYSESGQQMGSGTGNILPILEDDNIKKNMCPTPPASRNPFAPRNPFT